MFKELIDIKENNIYIFDYKLLKILLKDMTTGKNILWGTDNYLNYGHSYGQTKEMYPESITGCNGNIIKPRIKKEKAEQLKRSRDKAEVFTPSWLCNKQNNSIDNAWFGTENIFNIEKEFKWTTNKGKIKFKKRTWQEYVNELRLEVACGEAPYLVSRYDTTNGKVIPVIDRIGLLDRKLRVVNENTSDYESWFKWAKQAYKSVYGFEWQGDSLLIARENLLYTFSDNYLFKFGKKPTIEEVKEIATIIAHNIFQMDGIKYVIPYSCTNETTIKQTTLDKKKTEIECLGCKKNKQNLQNGTYAKIMDWKTNKKIKFITILSKNSKINFEAIVGNPPYQIKDGGAQSSAKPVYHLFVNLAKNLNPNYISMIIPSRWFAAGKGLDTFRDSMLNDKNICLLHDYLNASVCFPGVEIKGGVSYFLRNKNLQGKCLIITHKKDGKISQMYRYLKEDNCDVFIRYNEAINIINKIKKSGDISFSNIVNARKPFGLATNFKDYSNKKTTKEYIKLYANHSTGFISLNKIEKNKNWINKWKVYIPEAIGSGDTFTDRVKPILGKPKTACTETYLVVGPFETKQEAYNCIKYTQTKFFHFMLGVKKITQHTTSKVYSFVPMQNFKNCNNINWENPIKDIDASLYKKYGLTKEESKYINENVGEIVEVKQ